MEEEESKMKDRKYQLEVPEVPTGSLSSVTTVGKQNMFRGRAE